MATRRLVERARALRRRLTPPEARLWVCLRRGQLDGLKFRRQHPIGRYVLDFYCAEAKLAVEVDGAGHDHPDQMRWDQARTAWLAAQGVRVIRVAAEDVRVELDGVVGFIRAAAVELVPSTASRSPSPSLRDGEETD